MSLFRSHKKRNLCAYIFNFYAFIKVRENEIVKQIVIAERHQKKHILQNSISAFHLIC